MCYYEIKIDNKLLVTGKTKHPFVNKNLKPIRIPKDIKQVLEKHLEKYYRYIFYGSSFKRS
jgi:acyl-CoA thioester hydrolase